jgi:hypothetical protein
MGILPRNSVIQYQYTMSAFLSFEFVALHGYVSHIVLKLGLKISSFRLHSAVSPSAATVSAVVLWASSIKESQIFLYRPIAMLQCLIALPVTQLLVTGLGDSLLQALVRPYPFLCPILILSVRLLTITVSILWSRIVLHNVYLVFQ